MAHVVPDLTPRLRAIVDELEALGDRIGRVEAMAVLGRHDVRIEDVAGFVEESPHAYTRRRVARTDAFEMLVMTWRPGQGSMPHDHARSLCAMRIVRGRVTETRYEPATDGLVDPVARFEVSEGEVLVDVNEHVHSLGCDPSAKQSLVTLHVYAPPLPELRRFAARASEQPSLALFHRAPSARARTVAIVGGGFSGTLAAAHLIRGATERDRPLHVVVIDRQAAFGEGAAYRTADPSHLLNVPASNMSAFPDRKDDFLAWARARDPDVQPGDFLPRRRYGEYVRERMFEIAEAAADHVSGEIVRGEVGSIAEGARGRWSIEVGDRVIDADAIVLATGHRPPDDPLAGRWTGSRARYVDDPWASLALTAIGPDEPVVLIGTGLTAIDVLLTVTRGARRAPVIGISRRGLMPASHARAPQPALDPRGWLEPLLAVPEPSVRELLHGLRAAIARADDWRPVIDGLRPHTARVWSALSEREQARFLRHAKTFWEVRRHRTAPKIADAVQDRIDRGAFRVIAGRLASASASEDGVSVAWRPRGSEVIERIDTAWVVNCTGPGAGPALGEVPFLRSLIEGGHVELDAHGLGVRSDAEGRAVAGGRARGDLSVIGTLRKPQLWESTAVPELRQQARGAAEAVLDHLGRA